MPDEQTLFRSCPDSRAVIRRMIQDLELQERNLLRLIGTVRKDLGELRQRLERDLEDLG